MKLEDIVHTIASAGQAETLANITASTIQHGPARRLLMGYVDRRINQRLEEAYDVNERRAPGVVQDKAYIFRALAHSVDRALARGHVSEAAVRGVLRGLVNAFMRSERRAAHERFFQEHGGYGPPGFLEHVLKLSEVAHNISFEGRFTSKMGSKSHFWASFPYLRTPVVNFQTCS